jgi:hypothetical protein
VDVIYFEVPQGVPYGCRVAVALTAGGVAANTTMIAVTADDPVVFELQPRHARWKAVMAG